MKFCDLFKKYRLKSEIKTLKDFNLILREKGYRFEDSLMSRWQNGSRIPKNRQLVFEIISIFYSKKAIQDLKDINKFLSSLEMSEISNDELYTYFPNLELNLPTFNSYNLISDLETEKEFLKCIKTRNLDQKYMYRNRGASLWKEITNKKVSHTSFLPVDSDSAPHELKNSRVQTAFISLGCGYCRHEINIIKDLSKSNKNSYFGIDFSKSMLELANRNTYSINMPKYFINADVTSVNFRKDISEITENYKLRVFSFLGGTFGNFNQIYLLSTLYNLLKKGDILWIDFLNKKLNKEQYLDTYKKYCKTQFDFHFNPLSSIGFCKDDIVLDVSLSKEDYPKSDLFKFYFEIVKNCKIEFLGEELKFFKKEKIQHLEIRIYDKTELIKFVSNMGLSLIENFLDSNDRENLVFKKL